MNGYISLGETMFQQDPALSPCVFNDIGTAAEHTERSTDQQKEKWHRGKEMISLNLILHTSIKFTNFMTHISRDQFKKSLMRQ